MSRKYKCDYPECVGLCTETDNCSTIAKSETHPTNMLKGCLIALVIEVVLIVCACAIINHLFHECNL